MSFVCSVFLKEGLMQPRLATNMLQARENPCLPSGAACACPPHTDTLAVRTTIAQIGDEV